MTNLDLTNRAAWSRELRAHRLGYPSDRLVALASRRFPGGVPSGSARALDVGFGSGQHLRWLIEMGFRTSGIEVLPEAVEAAGHELSGQPLFEGVQVADVADRPFRRGTFDCAVAWGVMFLRPVEEMERDIAAIAEMLSDNGRAFINFRTPDNWFFGLGEHLGGSTYRLDERAREYANMTYTFLGRDEVLDVLSRAGLETVEFERLDYWRDDARQRHSWWLVAADRASAR